MPIDNSAIVRNFVPATSDGDTFLYTELLNRNRKSGNNKGRLVRTFYHRSQEEFDSQLPDIRAWCDWTGARAYTRLGARSFRKVAAKFATHVMEQVLAENWEGMRHGYSHCCGISSPVGQKYWLWDVDHYRVDVSPLENLPEWVCNIPSKSAFHVITKPFDVRALPAGLLEAVPLHKDNPTNLYIP